MSVPLPLRVGDAGHTLFGPPNGEPSPEVIAQHLRPSHAREIAAAVNCHAGLVAFVRELLAECETCRTADWLCLNHDTLATKAKVLLQKCEVRS